MMFKHSKKSLLVLAIGISCTLASSLDSAQPKVQCEITLNGETTTVYFNDGDTFKVIDGVHIGSRVRISGFNALESYGPVHEWLGNTTEDLYKVANLATDEARKGNWSCVLEGGRDAYGRLIARCDDLAHGLLEKGLAHAYSMDEKSADQEYLSKQKKAQKFRIGMWAGGIPDHIITSLHSIAEGHEEIYNRLISAADGSTSKMYHQEDYETCQKVCIEDGKSCMIFVPFNERYGKNKSSCLYLNKKP